MFDGFINALESRIRQKYADTQSFLKGLVLLPSGALASALILWVVIFSSYQELYGDVFSGVSSHLAMRSVFGGALDELINWVTRGDAPSAVRAPIKDFFDYHGSLTGLGRLLRLLAVLSIPFVMGEQIRRLLRYRNKEE